MRKSPWARQVHLKRAALQIKIFLWVKEELFQAQAHHHQAMRLNQALWRTKFSWLFQR